MATIPISTSGSSNFKISKFARRLLEPFLKTSYWAQRNTERGFHGVFCQIKSKANHDLRVIPFWSSMTDAEKQDTQDTLGHINLEEDFLCVLYHGILQEHPHKQGLGKSDYFILFSSEGFWIGELHLSDNTDTFVDKSSLNEGFSTIGMDLNNFFAHFSPHAYEAM